MPSSYGFDVVHQLATQLRARRSAGARTRFAPSPTGHLHRGHVVNAVFVWGGARAVGARIVLRIEDHDAQRCRREYECSILEDLEWLGLEPDEGSPQEFRAGACAYRQRDRSTRYQQVADALWAAGHTYWCACSRSAIALQTSPSPEGERRYPGTCRDIGLGPTEGGTLRLRVPAESVRFDDALVGSHEQVPAEQCGDFVLRDNRGNWSYQFAVVVDDLDQEIDLIVRGRDLLSSTGRQLLLARRLGSTTMPAFVHHPPILGADGAKLSKSEGAAGIREQRAAGDPPKRVLGRAAWLAGLLPREAPITAAELPHLFSF